MCVRDFSDSAVYLKSHLQFNSLHTATHTLIELGMKCNLDNSMDAYLSMGLLCCIESACRHIYDIHYIGDTVFGIIVLPTCLLSGLL